MDIKGSKTEKNLQKAFAGESMARNKYNYYASKARKDGFEQIAAIFDETANNEKEHAKLWHTALYGTVADTYTNLLEAAAGEHGEWADMYRKFAEVAKSEGFEDLAKKIQGVGNIEKKHEERFLKLADNIKNNKVFDKDESATWQCINCGHVMSGKSAPKQCPVCHHPRAFFQIKEENF